MRDRANIFTNSGIVLVEGSVELVTGTTILQNQPGGTIFLEAGSLDGSGWLENTGAIITRDPAGFTRATSSIGCSIGNFFEDPGDGSITVDEGILNIEGEFDNGGSVTVDNGATMNLGVPPATLTKSTMDQAMDHAKSFSSSTVKTNAATGQWDVFGTVNIIAGVNFVNQGTVTIGGDGVLANEGNFDHRENGVLAGSGIFNNTGGDFLGAGVFRPGGSTGILTFTGDFSQTETSEIEIEIGGSTAGDDYDQIQISGSATLDGAVYVSLVNGFEPLEGDSFSVLTIGGGPRSSTDFNCFSGLEIPGGLFLEPVQEADVFALVARDSTTGNEAPLAVADFDTTNSLTPITIPVLANDSDPNLDPLRIALIYTGMMVGDAVIDPGDSTLTYTPSRSMSFGVDTLHYIVTDCAGGGDSGIVIINVSDNTIPHPTSSVPTSRSIPERYALQPNVPNPFNPETAIHFAIPEQGFVRLVVYDIGGRKVVILAEEYYDVGEFERTWNGRDESNCDVPSGIYFAHLQAGDFVATRKMVLIR